MVQRFNRREIRDILTDFFVVQELDSFCEDNYPGVKAQFAVEASTSLKIDKLFEHCSINENNFDTLIKLLESACKEKVESEFNDFDKEKLIDFCKNYPGEIIKNPESMSKEKIILRIRDYYMLHPKEFSSLKNRLKKRAPKDNSNQWYWLDRYTLHDDFTNHVLINSDKKFLVFLYESNPNAKGAHIPGMLREWYHEMHKDKEVSFVMLCDGLSLTSKLNSIESLWAMKFKKRFNVIQENKEHITSFLEGTFAKQHLFVSQSIYSCSDQQKLKYYIKLWSNIDFHYPFFLILDFTHKDFEKLTDENHDNIDYLSADQINHFYCNSKYHEAISLGHLSTFYKNCIKPDFPYEEDYFIEENEYISFREAVDKLILKK